MGKGTSCVCVFFFVFDVNAFALAWVGYKN